MIRLETDAALRLGQRASEIGCLCRMIAEALEADPDTACAGTAVDGIGSLAELLARDLLLLPNSEA